MQRIIFCKGLPASGKSTWARKFVDEHPGYVRLNKDEIRKEVGGKHSKKKEAWVKELRNQRFVKALLSGLSVIVDDTNLNPAH